MTKYVILRLEEDEGNPGVWRQVPGFVEASSTDRAIRTLTHTGENTYVAVPVRSWNPVEVKVEQTTKVTIG